MRTFEDIGYEVCVGGGRAGASDFSSHLRALCVAGKILDRNGAASNKSPRSLFTFISMPFE